MIHSVAKPLTTSNLIEKIVIGNPEGELGGRLL
jgi:hypothetical protein